jgi:hypothetical protein
MDQPEAQASAAAVVTRRTHRTPVRSPSLNGARNRMDPQLLDALADILADALLADLEKQMEEEQVVNVATAESPTGSGSQSPASPEGSAGVGDIATAA